MPGEDAVFLLDEGLDPLRAAGATVAMVPGNDDCARRLRFGTRRSAAFTSSPMTPGRPIPGCSRRVASRWQSWPCPIWTRWSRRRYRRRRLPTSAQLRARPHRLPPRWEGRPRAPSWGCRPLRSPMLSWPAPPRLTPRSSSRSEGPSSWRPRSSTASTTSRSTISIVPSSSGATKRERAAYCGSPHPIRSARKIRRASDSWRCPTVSARTCWRSQSRWGGPSPPWKARSSRSSPIPSSTGTPATSGGRRLATGGRGHGARDLGFLEEVGGRPPEVWARAVVDVLRGLEAGGRIVGVISHVRELQQALPSGITVEPTVGASLARVHYPPE